MGYLLLITIAVFILTLSGLVLSMPAFFTSMPPKEEWFKKGVYELNVYMSLFAKEKHPIQKTVSTYLLLAYMYVRLLALYQDVKTWSSNWDVLWGYKEV